MATQEKTWNVANRLHALKDSDNPEVNHIIAGADEIYDDVKQIKQSEHNSQTDSRLDDVESDINAQSSGIKDRLATLENEVSFEGEIQVENTPQGIVSGSGKVATANAVSGAVNVRTGYFVCETAPATAAKTVDAPGFVLTAGGSMKVKMANTNTADSVTLNINSTGAKPLYYAGEIASANNPWEAGETVEVYYDGTNYYANNVAGGSGFGDGAFDVSAKYPTSGVGGGNTYTLEGAIAVLDDNLSASKKKGGMDIKFIDSDSGKYKQWHLLSPNFNTTLSNWKSIDTAVLYTPQNLTTLEQKQARANLGFGDGDIDDKPIAGGSRIINSGGVFNSVNYTTSPTLNGLIKYMAIDLSGYTGTEDLTKPLGLYLYNVDSAIGFQINVIGGAGREFEKLNYSSDTKQMYLESKGCKFYIELNTTIGSIATVISGTLNAPAFHWDSRISDLQSSVSSLSATVENNTTSIGNINTAISDLPTIRQTVSDTSSGLTSLNTEVDALETTLNRVASDNEIQNYQLFGFSGSLVNYIQRINTNVPSVSWFQNKTASWNIYGCINEDDTESPFKDLIGKKITLTPYISDNARNWVGFNRGNVHCNRIQFSCWVKRADILVDENIGFTFRMYTSQGDNRRPIKLSVVLNEKVTVTTTNIIFSATGTLELVYEKDGWCQFLFTYDITWYDTSETSVNYVFEIAKTSNPLVIVNPQLVEDGANIPSGIYVIPDSGNTITPYPDFLCEKVLENTQDIATLDTTLSELVEEVNKSKKSTFHYVTTPEQDSNIVTSFDNANNFLVNFQPNRLPTTGHNAGFNYLTCFLVNKSTQASTYVHPCFDDVAPPQFNGTYIGGNHGDAARQKVTMPNHGKTYADIGSTYSCDGKLCYIVGIEDADNIYMIGQNTLTYPKWSFDNSILVSGKTLTHVSGGTHTSDIVISAVDTAQWWPANKVVFSKIFADGAQITEAGDYLFETLKICEAYDIFNTADFVSKIIANVGQFSDNPDAAVLNVDMVVRVSSTYIFYSAMEWRIASTFIALQDINLGRFGYLQQIALNGGNLKMYLPKVLPITTGSNTVDLRTIVNWPNVNLGTVQIDATKWENPNLPPDRYVQYSDYLGISSGYIFDYGVGGNNRKDCVKNSFYFPSSGGKCYPNGIDSKITVNAGDSYSCVMWRSYIDRSKLNTSGVICTNCVEYEGSCYLYFDFNQVGNFNINMPDKYVGRAIEIFEKSDNVVLLDKIANGKVLVNVTSANPMYGYLVAKIK